MSPELMAPELSDEPFHCMNCGAGFERNPHVERFLHGNYRFFELATLCWVCRRLKISAAQEVQ